MERDKETRFWALYYHIFESLKNGLSLSEVSVQFTGEQLEAVFFFNKWIKTQSL